MTRKGNSIIRGLEISEIVAVPNKAYADEWLAYYQHFIETKVLKGIMKDAAITELTQHATDESRHATMISDRIVQLDSTPLLHPQEWFAQSHCGYDAPDSFDVVAILTDAIKGEQCVIATYSMISEMTKDKDIVTYNIVSQILADEVEHEEDLQSLHDDIYEFIESVKETV